MSSSSYSTVVQELYISYFGRPADSTGLSNFEAALAALNAPLDINGLASAMLPSLPPAATARQVFGFAKPSGE